MAKHCKLLGECQERAIGKGLVRTRHLQIDISGICNVKLEEALDQRTCKCKASEARERTGTANQLVVWGSHSRVCLLGVG